MGWKSRQASRAAAVPGPLSACHNAVGSSLGFQETQSPPWSLRRQHRRAMSGGFHAVLCITAEENGSL